MMDDKLNYYFTGLTKSEPLTREREAELSDRIKQGDMVARDELVRANLRFVVRMANGYLHRGLTMAELISAGNLALVVAAQRFDSNKDCKFISYAIWWIRSYMQQAITDESRTVRLPMSKTRLIGNINTTSRRLEQQADGGTEVEDLAQELSLPATDIVDALIDAVPVSSLDAPLMHQESGDLLGKLPDTSSLPDAAAEYASDRALLDRVLDKLEEREQMIVRLYFGLDGAEIHTLAQIGELLEISRERVRQIKSNALDKLKQLGHKLNLRSLVETY